MPTKKEMIDNYWKNWTPEDAETNRKIREAMQKKAEEERRNGAV